MAHFLELYDKKNTIMDKFESNLKGPQPKLHATVPGLFSKGVTINPLTEL